MVENVVIIVADALRADRVGALGGRDLTPNIDDFASDAAVFTKAFSPFISTDPAVTTIHTGRYPLSHGVVEHGRQVTDDMKRAVEHVQQLQQVLSDEGYFTAKYGRPLGRWHRKGFDRYPESTEGRDAFDRVSEGNQSSKLVWKLKGYLGSLLYELHPAIGSLSTTAYQNTVGRIGGSTMDKSDADIFMPSSVGEDRVLANFDGLFEQPAPRYAFVHLMDTHSPYAARREFVEECLDRYSYEDISFEQIRERFPRGSKPYTETTAGVHKKTIDKFNQETGTDHDYSTRLVSAHYDATVREADERIGALLDRLRQDGTYDDSLIVIVADHGESLTEHDIYYSHHGLYDQTTNVPLLIHPPGGCDRTYGGLVSTMDIAPTVLSYAGDSSHRMEPEGRSLRPVIEDGATLDREVVMAEDVLREGRRMIRTETEKVIYVTEGNVAECSYCHVQHAPELEYYRVDDDPDETDDRSDSAPERVKELREQGEEMAAEFRANHPGSEGEAIEYEGEEDIMEQLDALGYR